MLLFFELEVGNFPCLILGGSRNLVVKLFLNSFLFSNKLLLIVSFLTLVVEPNEVVDGEYAKEFTIGFLQVEVIQVIFVDFFWRLYFLFVEQLFSGLKVFCAQASPQEEGREDNNDEIFIFCSQAVDMISKAKSKYIKSLQIKKYRKQEQCFLAEGKKSILELFNSDFEIVLLAATGDFLQQYTGLVPKGIDVMEATAQELRSLGEFQSNETGLAVVRMKPNEPIASRRDEFALVLDDIRDPGNLGTIIRTADWYGVDKIIASKECAEFYNSKVISATMGSFTRVRIFYTDLVEYLGQARQEVFGAFLNGENVHAVNFGAGGLIVIGNESNGISPEVEKLVTRRITIPRFGKAESLNAAIATSIVLDNVRRK